MNKEALLSSEQELQFREYTKDLLRKRPVQYVLGEAWFAGMKFFVNEHVLIPRPETEELVEWINKGDTILDIGTGSGCIPVALKKKYPDTLVYACDISEGALQVAQANANTNNTAIGFIHCDVLNKNEWHKLPEADIIVSNPPYIPLDEKASMHENVLEFEPHLALFVSNEDPLIFYKAIADLAKSKLKRNGVIYFEIHEDLGSSVQHLLESKNFRHVELKKDLQGKDRMIRAVYEAPLSKS